MAFTTSKTTRLAAATAGLTVALSPMPALADEATPATPGATAPAETAEAKKKVSKAKKKAQRKRAKRAAARKRADRTRGSLVRVALNQKGDRYVSGRSGPNSFDCSGFTKYVYKKAAGKELPHYSGAQMRKARRVSTKNLKPGDLLFYGRGGSQHVSMYIGKGKMIHATNPRSGVKIDSIHAGYYKSRFAGAGRLLKH
jgi:cell wall-associated NlpC family hydrolase